MAHIPMDDIQTLWNEIQEKSWSGLHQNIATTFGQNQRYF